MASDILLQQQVEIYLNTPLYPFRYKEGKARKQFTGEATHLSGMILEERTGGLIIGVDAVSTGRQLDESPPLKRIFLPYHKIDFILCA